MTGIYEIKSVDEKNIVYHGNNVEVSIPRILQNGFYKDFGYGFYCTSYEKQAKRWAMTRKGASIVNYYKYKPETSLKVLKFDEMTDEWLDFVVDCRQGIEHDYDIVEGPMADDQIWNFVEGFIDGRISRSVFWELVRFNGLTSPLVKSPLYRCASGIFFMAISIIFYEKSCP